MRETYCQQHFRIRRQKHRIQSQSLPHCKQNLQHRNLTLSSKDRSIITMFNQTLNLESSHAMYGRVTPRLQSVRPSCEDGDLLNQEASNAFPLLCYQRPCLREHYYPTAILNFYRFLSCISRKCHTIIHGIRAVFITRIYTIANYLTLSVGGVHQ